MRPLFVAALFTSAALLFAVQPAVGKRLLPLFGGGPGVWGTCLVFFQSLLLLGYLYAHRLTALPRIRTQIAVHIAVLTLAALGMVAGVLFAPDHLPLPLFASLASGSEWPVPNVLALLVLAVGLPLFALSATAPLLQKWFTATAHPAARDPYFLYAASNAGSLLALAAYPLLIEPLLPLSVQAWMFAAGFTLLAPLLLLCGRTALHPFRPPHLTMPEPADASAPPTRADKLRWLLLAAVPSALLLGVTHHLSTDIAPVPLLWVVPLAFYLLSFVVAFAPAAERLKSPLASLARIVLPVLVFFVTAAPPLGVGTLAGIHAGGFALLAVVLHLKLASRRPAARHLTTFYLWVSIGGVIGGVFVALLAPLVFPLPAEYAAALAAAAFLIPRSTPAPAATAEQARSRRLIDAGIPFAMILACMALRVADGSGPFDAFGGWLADRLTAIFHFSGLRWMVEPRAVRYALVYAPPCLLAFAVSDRPPRFGLAVLAVLFVNSYLQVVNPAVRATARSYFGAVQVVDDDGTKLRAMLHGTTVHGRQWLPGGGPTAEPLAYFHPTGPCGEVLRFSSRPGLRAGCVGLGAGSVAAYFESGQSLTFYEIDPKVPPLAEEHFTFLKDARSRGANVGTVLGDARLSLAAEGEPLWLLIVDAFSSDSIPTHLLTVEAMAIYRKRLAGGGVLAVHLSNRHLDLAPVVAAVAKAHGLGCRVRSDICDAENGTPLPGTPPGKFRSTWAVVAEDDVLDAFDRSTTTGTAAVAGGLAGAEPQWTTPDATRRPWTDDHADLLNAIRRGR